MKGLLRFFYRAYRYVFHGPVYIWLTKKVFFLRIFYKTRKCESPVTFRMWFMQKVLGFNRRAYWPVHFTSTISGSSNNIYVGIDAAPGISPGCYIQAVGKIFIDDYAQIAPNVGIISANHFMLDVREHVRSEVRIGKYSRIGMGSIILPGVVLGDFTTVSAGSVVRDSFPDGFCVIGGNPAVMMTDYSSNEKIKAKFLRYQNEYLYNGYIRSEKFEAFRKKNLNV